MIIKQTTAPHAEFETEQLTVIGTFKNEWRMRHVSIYDHPTDDTLVIT